MHPRTLPFVLPLLVGGLTATAAERQQAPDARWRTIPTVHYRIHYPDRPEFVGFAKDAASRIEGIHTLLEQWVGHALPGPTDVVVQNPLAAANGMTLPFLDRPGVVLWTEAPDSDSEIAHERNWVELLLLHELVHLHHLTTPDRKPNPLTRIPQALKSSALLQKAPAWIVEGYATVLEGRLTGSGRPHGAYRAMVLRQRAREGRLPAYEDLGKVDWPTVSGTHYLVGSAFMEWLVKDQPDPARTYQTLWKRLSSKRYPKFDPAFRATFGEAPQDAYGRFVAQLTHSSVELERRLRAAGLREGEVWGQVKEGYLKDLSVSPDGTRLLGLQISEKLRGLQLWDLVPREDEKDRAKAREKDPDLPEEVKDQYPLHSSRRSLERARFAVPTRPRWEADGSIRFRVPVANEEGIFRYEERRWQPDPLKAAAAPLILPLHPVLKGQAWTLSVEGRDYLLPFEPFGPLAWDRSRRQLFASTPLEGIPNLVRLDFDPSAAQPFGSPVPLTRVLGGAAYPAPTPDGKALYFAHITARGSEVRRLDLTEPPPALAPVSLEPSPLAPGAALSQPDTPALTAAPAAVPADRPYAVRDSLHAGPRFGVVVSPSGRAQQLGLGGSDVLGRLSWQALGSFQLFPGEKGMGPRGAMAGLAWRGSAWAPSLQVYSVLSKPSDQLFQPVQGFDQERRGAELALTREWANFPTDGSLRLGLAQERVDLLQGTRLDRKQASLALEQRAGWNWNRFALKGGLNLKAASGRTEGESWNLQRGGLRTAFSYKGWVLQLEGEAGRLGGQPGRFDRFQQGGQSEGLLAQGLEFNQVFQAALPTFTATGDRFRRWKADFEGFYLEQQTVWNAEQPRPAATRVVGYDLRLDFATLPFERDLIQRYLGRPEVRLGLHRPLDGAMKERTVFTLAFLTRF